MGGGSRQSSRAVSQPVDVRSATERARDEKAASLQLGMLNEPDLGYDDASGTYQDLRRQEEDRFREGVIGQSSDLGFSPRKSGVSASVIGRGLTDIGIRETARRGQEFQDWRRWMLGGGRAGQSIQGQAQRSTEVTKKRGASPWATAAGRLTGGVIGRRL